MSPCGNRVLALCALATLVATAPAGAHEDDDLETITITESPAISATVTQVVPAEAFELRPLESGGQLLEAVPGVLTAQHTGGGKAEQYFLRGFDADHGTDLAVYFDGVPVNLRSHAHGQGFLDLHFVTPETIDRLDARKGPYSARYGDFATAAMIGYEPATSFEKSRVSVAYGEFDTLRTVAVLSPRTGVFAENGPARGFLSFEAYHTDGPFENPEDLARFSAMARGEVDLSPSLRLSGHLLGYYADWNASGLIPQALVDDGTLDRFGSLDPTEGGETTRAQGKIQLDWDPSPHGHLLANLYVSYYDFELFSNFTYFLNDPSPTGGDGIVQRDRGRLYTGGRIEYVHTPHSDIALEMRGGLETRFDDASVFLGNQTRRVDTGVITDDDLQILSVEPYADVSASPLSWLRAQAGLRMAYFRFDGRDRVAGANRAAEDVVRWLPKGSVRATPFAPGGLLPLATEGLRDLELFVSVGQGYHSNDARAVLSGQAGDPLPRALGAEVGARTRILDRIDLALDYWYLSLDDELVFVGDEGTTESAGESVRHGIEFATTLWLLDWWYARGDVGYTSARLVDPDTPVPQAPRFIAKAATGVRYEGFAAELGLRHLGNRYAVEGDPGPKLSDYTVLDLAVRYRQNFLEIGFSVENLTDTEWSSSEFFYTSQPAPAPGGTPSDDFHFSPGNPRNLRVWVTAHF